MWRPILITLFLLGQFGFTTLQAEEIAVIANQSIDIKNLSYKQLRNIFLKKVGVTDTGLRLIPVNINPNHPLRFAFTEAIFNQKPEEMELYWNSQYFQGITPPFVVASEEAMLRFVSSTPGAIGYISSCYLNHTVQLVFKLNAPDTFKQNCDQTTEK